MTETPLGNARPQAASSAPVVTSSPANPESAPDLQAHALTVVRTDVGASTPQGQVTALAPSAPTVSGRTPYSGPRSGIVSWTGDLESGEFLWIDRDQASKGKVSGQLPGVPVRIDFDTSQFMVAETPNPENGWRRLVVLSQTKRHAVISIRWTVMQ